VIKTKVAFLEGRLLSSQSALVGWKKAGKIVLLEPLPGAEGNGKNTEK